MKIHYPLKKILIVGTTGSGKTTLAVRISEKLGLPQVELDALYWAPGWQKNESFEDEIATILLQEEWVIEGWFGDVARQAWAKADLVIWMHPYFIVNLKNLINRTLIRCWSQEPLYNDNKESFHRSFFSRDSIIL